jgi:chemotaxis protein MotA
MGFGYERFVRLFSLIKMAYFPKRYNVHQLIEDFGKIAIKMRQYGLISAEKEIDTLSYAFPRKLLKFVMDGTDARSIENIAASEIKAMQNRHYSNIVIFNKMGGYAPTMGILGTVMALIMTLANAGSNPDVLIHNIASAFIATLWGVFSANIFWLPIADKLKQCHLEEKHMMEISLEGVLSIQSGEIPTVIKSRLVSMLPQKEQEEFFNN